MAKPKDDLFQLQQRLSEVFKPATPINQRALFFGRERQVFEVVNAINQEGQHIILYGERGVGKTSLAKQLLSRLYSTGGGVIVLPHVNCDSGDDYSTIWKKVFMEIIELRDRHKLKLSPNVNKLLRSLVPKKKIDPDLVRRTLAEIGMEVLLVIVLDEFDTITDPDLRRLIADTVKVLSDRSTPATVIMIGVADDVAQLIDDHESIERCLAQIRMPRMSRHELEDIVTEGLKVVELSIEDKALAEISGLSKGLPHYTHLLGLNAGRCAIEGKSSMLNVSHVKSAIGASIDGAQHSIRNAYHKATLSQRRTASYVETLLACAMAETDDFGFFAAVDVRAPLATIMEKVITVESYAKKLHKFCEEERGPVLRKTDLHNRSRFRFVNPLMQPFVLMKGIAEGLIVEDDLNLESDPQKRLFR